MRTLLAGLSVALLALAASVVSAHPADRYYRHPLRVCPACEGADIAPDVAADGLGNYVVVWKRTDTNEIWAALFAANGTPRDNGTFRVAQAAERLVLDPVVSMASDGRFVVAWVEASAGARTIYAQRYSPIGARYVGLTTVSSPSHYPVSLDLVTDAGSNYVLAWASVRPQDGIAEGYARAFGAFGDAHGPPVLVTATVEGGTVLPRVTMGRHGDYFVIWQERTLPSSDRAMRGRRFSFNGEVLDPTFGIAGDAGSSKLIPDFAVASDLGGNFTVAYGYGTGVELNGLYVQRRDSLGRPLGRNETRVSAIGPAVETEVELDLDVDADGDFVVAWNQRDSSTGPSNLHARLFDETGAAITRDLAFPSGPAGPRDTHVSMDANGDFVVSWQRPQRPAAVGPYVQRFAGPDDRAAGCAHYLATQAGTSAGETIRGTAGHDIIVGLGGNDRLFGGGGDDVLCGSAGDDQLFGEAGHDLLTGSFGDDVLDGGDGRDVCIGNADVNADSALQCETVRSVP